MGARRLPPFIPNRLRKHRRQRSFSQREVASLLGLKNANRISKWERGVSMPDALNLLKLSIIYRTLPYDLYFDLFQELKRELCTREQELLGCSEDDFFKNLYSIRRSV